jgi:hypothetical protein
MWTRRQLLSRGCGALFGVAGGALMARALNLNQQATDGNLARNMINAPAETAINQGLAYLEAEGNRLGNGSFGTGPHVGNVAITSLAGLAMMAGGHQPGRGRYGHLVTRSLRFVLDQEQQNRGFLHNVNAPMHHGPMYGHGFGTLFLAEAHGMVNNRQLRARLHATLTRAVRLIIDTQNPEGGWRYQPQVEAIADLSVTICQIMALRAARNAGISVPIQTINNCTRYVNDCQDRNDGGFCYTRQQRETGFARTAAGVVALYSAGVYKGDSVKKGLDYLMRNCKPGGGPRNNRMNQDMQTHFYYGHYYAAQAMWIAGGRYWTEWYPGIRDELIHHPDRQILQNGTQCSWWDRRVCVHYGTAMALIILQIPNNYLPIFQR